MDIAARSQSHSSSSLSSPSAFVVPTTRGDVAYASSALRPTPPQVSFASVLRAGAGNVARGATAAMTMLPGSPLVTMALRGERSASTGRGIAAGAMGPGSSVSGSASSAGTSVAGERTAEGPGATPASVEPGVEGSLQNAQEMNLYYLQVQEQVNAQNRSFSTLSNVMKAQHDTVKTAIGNIR